MNRTQEVDVDEVLKALANPLRREILRWLKEPEKHFPAQTHPMCIGVCVSRIYEKAGLSQSTVSTYLALLQRAGLVESERKCGWTFYRRNEPFIEAFLAEFRETL